MDDKVYEAARSSTAEGAADIPSYELSRLTPGDQSNVLHVAAQYGNHEFIPALFAGGIHELLCKRNSNGETPLHLAAQSGCRKTVEILLNAHDEEDRSSNLLGCWGERDNQGNTPLHTALRYGHEDIALLLLERDLQLVSLYNNVGESLAYLAAQNFCPKFLLKALDYDRASKCSVSFSGPFGQTAFHPARKLSDTMLSILVERRKHLLKVKDIKGKTVLAYAVEESRESMVETLLKADTTLAYLHDNDGFTPLHKAASLGFFQMVQTILDLSPQSITIRDEHHSKTALHVAKMDASFLERCVKKTRMKELINAVDNDGNTALHLALMKSDIRSADALLQVCGINWRLTNKKGLTPMDSCKSADQISLKMIPMEADEGYDKYMDDKLYEAARWSAADGGGDIPSDGLSLLRLTPGDKCNVLHVAARHGNHKFISALAAQWIMPFHELLCKRNSEGETPLHLGARSGCEETVEVLLNGHSPGDQNDNMLGCWSERDNEGNTPLHTALRYGHEDMALLLLERDLQLVSLYNNVGESLAYLAAQNFCPKFLEKALEYDGDNKCSVSFSGPLGQTAFHPARNLTGEIMSILVERRKQYLKVQDKNGKTVLDYAVEEKRDSIVRILLKADNTLAYLHDRDGLAPLHKAASRGLVSMVQTIMELSPQSMTIRDKHCGQTALHIVKMDPCSLGECLTNTRMRELINEVDNDGNTPLHLALMNSDKATAEKLLQVSGINWRLTNNQGHSPMDLCTCDDQIPLKLKSLVGVWRADKEMVNMKIFFHQKVVTANNVLDHNTWDECLSFRGPGGDTILHTAARNGNMIIIKRVKESNPARDLLLSGQNSNGETPLHLAAQHGQLKVVKFILELTSTPENGDQIDPSNTTENSVNHSTIVVVGSDIDPVADSVEVRPWRIKAANGDTPAHKAIRNKHEKIALRLLRHDLELLRFINNENEGLLYLAVENRCYDVMEDILSNEIACDDSITSGRGGQNVVHAISRCRKLHAHKANYMRLIEKQPQLLQKVDDNGKTPLHHAIEEHNIGAAGWLLRQDKATAFVYDNEGFTPLLRAAMLGRPKCIRWILSLCPQSADLRDLSDNRTALHLLKGLPHFFLQICMRNGKIRKLINETDKDGNTATHCAILDGDVDKALVLLETPGINWMIRNKQHQAPLDLCRQMLRSGHTQLRPVRVALLSLDATDGMTRPFSRWYASCIRFVYMTYNELLLMDENLKNLLDKIAVAAALLVAITFAAAFTIPGGYDQNTGEAMRIKQPAIKVFMASDVLAMLMAISILGWYTIGIRRTNLKKLAKDIIIMLQISLVATIIAFISGVYAIGWHVKPIITIPIFLSALVNLFFFFVPELFSMHFDNI